MKEDTLAVTKRTSEQGLRVDRPPPTLCCATSCSLPATQGQREGERLANLISDLISPRLVPKNEIHSFPCRPWKSRSSLCRSIPGMAPPSAPETPIPRVRDRPTERAPSTGALPSGSRQARQAGLEGVRGVLGSGRQTQVRGAPKRPAPQHEHDHGVEKSGDRHDPAGRFNAQGRT
jgi:hypothetical protein